MECAGRLSGGGNSIILSVAASHESAHLRISHSGLSWSSATGSSRTHRQPNKRTGELSHPKAPRKCTGPEIYPELSLGRLSIKKIDGCTHDEEVGVVMDTPLGTELSGTREKRSSPQMH